MLRKILLGSVGVGALALAAPAYAQDSGAGVTQLDTVTTVATRTPKSIFDTLGSVSTVTREEIERKVPSTFADIVKDMPNVDIGGGPRSMAQQLNIRGFGDDRIVLRLDGSRSNFNSGHRGRLFIDPDLLRSVEVFRGPGTLSGSGALGGAIAAELKSAEDFLDPGKSFGFRTKFGAASANDEFLQGYTAFGRTGPFQGLVSFTQRISGNIEAGNIDYSRNDLISEVPFSKDKIRAGLAKFNYEPAPGHKFFFAFQIFNDRNIVPVAPDGNFNATENPLARRKTDENRYIGGYNFKSTENGLFDFTARVYYNQVNIEETVIAGTTSLGRFDVTKLNTFGIDVYNTSRLSFWGGKVKSALTYGVEYYRDSQEGTRNGAPRTQYPDAKANVYGLYVQNELTLFDQFIVQGALRWDGFDQSADGQASYDRGRLNKSGALGWRPAPWLMVYGKYSEGFRAPSLSELYPTGTHFSLGSLGNNVFLPNPNLRPETSKTYEAGLALQFRNVFMSGDRIWFKGSAFQSDVKDFIDLNVIVSLGVLPPPVFFGCVQCSTQAVNVRDARISGFETEMGYISRWFFAGLAGSYLIGENRTTGNSLASIPPHKIVATIGTRIPDYDLMLGFRLTATSDQNRVPPESDASAVPKTPGWTTGDVFVSWVPSGRYISPLLRGFRLDAGIDNIWDKRYRRHLSIFPEAGINFKFAASYTVQF
ncbi:MAG: TonB-dependent hemoglobin/transferrin/lactoferrin family receptor [Rhodospirillaceae bacterium]|nr:TonB-dependent hemoglobin/transferrin/lactoferrin family receptor [Rhodospirillaceae bacterium]